MAFRSFGTETYLCGKTVLDYGFVSEKTLTEEELQTLLSLRREKNIKKKMAAVSIRCASG